MPQATICKCAAREPQKRDANRCYDSQVAFAARFCRNAQGLQKAREFNHVVCSCLAGSFRIQQGGGTGGLYLLLWRLPAYYFALCSPSICILLLSKKDKSSIPPMPASPRPRNRPQPQPAPQNSSSANASANASPQRSPKRADRRREALVRAFGENFEGLADIQKPRPHAEDKNKALHRLRCTRFTRARVDDLIKVVETVGAEGQGQQQEQGAQMAGGGVLAQHRAYAEAIDALASTNALQSLKTDADAENVDETETGSGSQGVSTAVRIHRLKNLMSCAIRWRVTNMDVRRFSLKRNDQESVAETDTETPSLGGGARSKARASADADADAEKQYEKVLEAMVPTREQQLSSDAAHAWFEVVPAEAGRVEKVLGKLWNSPDKGNFRGIRSLYNFSNSRYLGIQLKDVDEFIRKQELHQMLEPTPVGVYSPLVPTKLGWHQVDIMYATWDSATPKITEEELKRTSMLQGNIRTAQSESEAAEQEQRDLEKREILRRRGIREEYLQSVEGERKQDEADLERVDATIKQLDAEYRQLVDKVRKDALTMNTNMTMVLKKRFDDGEPDTETADGVIWSVCDFVDARKNANYKDGKPRLEILTEYRENEKNGEACQPEAKRVQLWQREEFLEGTDYKDWLKQWKQKGGKVLEKVYDDNSEKERFKAFQRAFEKEDGKYNFEGLRWPAGKKHAKQQAKWDAQVREFRENQARDNADLARLKLEIDTIERIDKGPTLQNFRERGGRYKGYKKQQGSASPKKSVAFRAGAALFAPSKNAVPRNWHLDLLGGARKYTTRSNLSKPPQEPGDGDIPKDEGDGKEETMPSEEEEDEKEKVSQGSILKKRGPPPQKYPYIMNVMDIYSKYAWSFPLKTAEASEQCEHLEKLWLQEGAPDILQTDGGFKSLELMRLAERFGVEHRSCAPYHSQCSGAIERLNRTIRGSIRKAKHGLGETLKRYDWVRFLPQIIASYNAIKHSTTQFSPYFVQRGRELHSAPVVALQRKEPTQDERSAKVPTNLFWKEPRRKLGGGAGGAGGNKDDDDEDVDGGNDNGKDWDEVERLYAEDNRSDFTANVIGRTIPYVVENVYKEVDDVDLPKAKEERGKLKGAQIESVRKFVEQSAEAAQKRNEIVSRGIRHAAVGMTADALIKAEEHLRPLASGTLVRVSYAHINLKVRQELKCGFKRARDLNSWSPELYYIVSPPSNADKLHNHGSLYKVNKVGKVAAPGDPDLSVARQDLLAISSPAASANDAQRVADLQSLMRGEDTVVKKYVTLRQNYDAPTAQRR